MSDGTFDVECAVRAHELEAVGHARLPALLDYMQEAAAQHAAELGFSHEDLSGSSLFWVLTRLYLRLSPEAVACGWPGWRERITVRTWSVGFERLLARRDFLLLDAQGRAMAAAVSSWVTLDAATRRLSAMPEHMRARIPACSEHALEYPGRKTPGLEPGTEGGMLVTARRSDLDVNGHVNNAVLAAWALDEAAARLSGYTGQISQTGQARCTALEVAFRAEVLPGESLRARAEEQEPGIFLLGLASDDGRERLRAVSWWEWVGQT